MCFGMTAFAAFVSLGVDWGHVQVAKTELQAAADGAARAGAGSLSRSQLDAIAAARWVAARHKSDGHSISLSLLSGDVQIGYWDKRNLTFITNVTGDRANAVRVVARRANSRGNAVDTPFASILGKKSQDVRAESIAISSTSMTSRWPTISAIRLGRRTMSDSDSRDGSGSDSESLTTGNSSPLCGRAAALSAPLAAAWEA